jgi:hypothetical protein
VVLKEKSGISRSRWSGAHRSSTLSALAAMHMIYQSNIAKRETFARPPRRRLHVCILYRNYTYICTYTYIYSILCAGTELATSNDNQCPSLTTTFATSMERKVDLVQNHATDSSARGRLKFRTICLL